MSSYQGWFVTKQNMPVLSFSENENFKLRVEIHSFPQWLPKPGQIDPSLKAAVAGSSLLAAILSNPDQTYVNLVFQKVLSLG